MNDYDAKVSKEAHIITSALCETKNSIRRQKAWLHLLHTEISDILYNMQQKCVGMHSKKYFEIRTAKHCF